MILKSSSSPYVLGVGAICSSSEGTFSEKYSYVNSWIVGA